MTDHKVFKRLLALTLWLLLIAGSAGSILAAPLFPSSPFDSRAEAGRPVPATFRLQPPVITRFLFLPLVTDNQPPVIKFGTDFGLALTRTDILESDLPVAKEMGADWSRLWLSWADIETEPEQYSWEVPDAILARFSQVGLKPLPVIYDIPDWAGSVGCGPITDKPAFERFLMEIIPRYKDDVEAWEFINEPDGSKPHHLGPAIGCWGPQPEAYAAYLEIFHNQVNSLDPGAAVLFGGLAYDNWAHFDRDFFENTLKQGAGPFFDVVGLHYYPINPVDLPTMAHKVNEIQTIMTRNNVTGKRIWITETSMWTNGSGGLEAQRDFIVEELARSFCAGVDNVFWFAVREEPTEPPLHRWLISKEHQPDQGYDTFQHLTEKLAGTSCLGPYQNLPPDVEAYQFETSGRSVYVLWSNGSPQTVHLPASTGATLTDRDGKSLGVPPLQNGQATVDVGQNAIFLEITE